MSEETKLCLYGEQARPFINNKLGTKVTLTIEAVLTEAGIEYPDHNKEYSDDSTEKVPFVEFTIASVDGGKKAYENMDVNEMEREIRDVMEGRDESVYTEQAKKEGLRQTPFKNLGKAVVR